MKKDFYHVYFFCLQISFSARSSQSLIAFLSEALIEVTARLHSKTSLALMMVMPIPFGSKKGISISYNLMDKTERITVNIANGRYIDIA